MVLRSWHVRMCVNRALSWHQRHLNMARVGEMTDIYDGSRWQDQVIRDTIMYKGKFTGQNLVFNISGDGICPFDNQPISMWPVALSCLNLPPWVRMTMPALWLLTIIPGPKEPKDFQPVLDIIADELNYLYRFGVGVSSSFPPEGCTNSFVCRAKLYGLVSG